VRVHSRIRSSTPVVVVLMLAALMLSACQKPSPRVTVFGDGKSVVVIAASYTYTGGTTRIAGSNAPVAQISVRAGTELLVDVPRSLADHAWIVAAYTSDANGKLTALDGAGSQTVSGKHSVWLNTPEDGSGEYFLNVTQLTGGNGTGAWVLRVNLHQ
jgi:hypothetical protein